MTFRSPIFELSHTYVEDAAALSPMDCTYLGNGLNQDKLDDFSIAGTQKSADLTKATLAKLMALQASNLQPDPLAAEVTQRVKDITAD